jgi:hypothetical protein
MSYILDAPGLHNQGNKTFSTGQGKLPLLSKVVSDNFDSGVNSILEDDTGALALWLLLL